TDTFGFPVGTDSIYYLAEIENNNLTGIAYINARFDSLTNHNDIDIIATESGNDYSSVCTEGVWFLTPDAAPASGFFPAESPAPSTRGWKTMLVDKQH
ncbi:MAG: hypothetical protein IIA88_11710, partial [Bacteroidetes bacterium]|nr:hypothetical protein [Bacteroidota bacterium]